MIKIHFHFRSRKIAGNLSFAFQGTTYTFDDLAEMDDMYEAGRLCERATRLLKQYSWYASIICPIANIRRLFEASPYNNIQYIIEVH